MLAPLRDRPRTAQLLSIGRTTLRPIVWLTILGVIVSAAISVCLAITATPTLHRTAMGQPVTIGFEPLSHDWCGSGQMTVVGAVIPIKPTYACSPIRPSISILGPIDIMQAAQSTADTVPVPEISAKPLPKARALTP